MRTSAILQLTAWASVGVLIAFAWGYYFAAANKALPVAPNVRALAALTQPAVAAFLSFDPAYRIGLYGGALVNAATYALFGLFFETVRRSYRPSVAN